MDNVAIPDNAIFDHYLYELYNNGDFSNDTVIEWNEESILNQTVPNTILFYRNKKKRMDKVTRLTGTSCSGNVSFTSANQEAEFGVELKEIIKQADLQAVEKKEGEHAVVLKELHTEQDKELQIII